MVGGDGREPGPERRVGRSQAAAPAALGHGRIARPQRVHRVVGRARLGDGLELGADLAGSDPPSATAARRQRPDRPAHLDDIERLEGREAVAPGRDRRRQALDDVHHRGPFIAGHDPASRGCAAAPIRTGRPARGRAGRGFATTGSWPERTRRFDRLLASTAMGTQAARDRRSGPADRHGLARRAPRGPRPPPRPRLAEPARLQQAPHPGRRLQRPASRDRPSRHGTRDRRRGARMADPDARADRRRPAPLGGRRGRPDRLLRRRRAQSTGDPRLLAAAAVPLPAGAAAHPRRRHRGLAAGGPRDDDRGPGG